MLYLGIDQSLTSTGLAILSPVSAEPVVLRTVEPKSLRGGARLAFIRKTISECLAGRSIAQAAMEGYNYGAGAGQLFELGEVGGIVKCLLAELDIPLISVAPSQLKKFVAHKSSADKDEMMAAVKDKWKLDIRQDDMADAYGLARVASVYASGISIYRPELEVVQSLKKPSEAVFKPRRGRGRSSL